MINVVITDDHPLVREGIKKVCHNTTGINIKGEAGSAKELMALLKDKLPDILILDISLPGKSGLDILKDITKWYPSLPVLILSIHSEERMAVRALKAGAKGYLNKSSISEELVKAIRKIAIQKSRYITPEVAEQLALQIDNETNETPHKKLSDRELQIFCLIASDYSIQEIAQKLSLSTQTVYTYKNRIKDKTNLQSTVEITRYAIENNLVD